MPKLQADKLDLAMTALRIHLNNHQCERCDDALSALYQAMTEWLKAPADEPKPVAKFKKLFGGI